MIWLAILLSAALTSVGVQFPGMAVSEAEAAECIFGVTCGNDVSARDWQKNDVQWWRAKGSDTFGPVGPFITSGLDYDNLLTGLRREATYYGAQNFVEKTTSALTPLLVGALLLLGSTTEDPLGMRLVGPVAGVLVLAGWLAFRRYDLPDEVLADPELAARAAGERQARSRAARSASAT